MWTHCTKEVEHCHIKSATCMPVHKCRTYCVYSMYACTHTCTCMYSHMLDSTHPATVQLLQVLAQHMLHSVNESSQW